MCKCARRPLGFPPRSSLGPDKASPCLFGPSQLATTCLTVNLSVPNLLLLCHLSQFAPASRWKALHKSVVMETQQVASFAEVDKADVFTFAGVLTSCEDKHLLFFVPNKRVGLISESKPCLSL